MRTFRPTPAFVIAVAALAATAWFATTAARPRSLYIEPASPAARCADRGAC